MRHRLRAVNGRGYGALPACPKIGQTGCSMINYFALQRTC